MSNNLLKILAIGITIIKARISFQLVMMKPFDLTCWLPRNVVVSVFATPTKSTLRSEAAVNKKLPQEKYYGEEYKFLQIREYWEKMKIEDNLDLWRYI